MSANNMEDLSKNNYIGYIRQVVQETIDKKSKYMTPLTKKARRNDLSNYYNSKSKLLKLYAKLKEYNKEVKSEKDVKAINKSIKELNSKVKSSVVKRKNTERKALGDAYKKYFLTEDLDYPLKFIMKRIGHQLEHEYDINSKQQNLIAYIVFMYQVKQRNPDKTYSYHIQYYNSETLYITSKNLIKGFMNDVETQFLIHLETAKHFSDTIFDKFLEIQISTARNKAMMGKSFIELPLWIKNKKACVNIKNNDDKCFKWALVASQSYDLIKASTKNLVSYYKKYEYMIKEPEGFTYPVTFNDIPAFEELNNMKINVLEINHEKQLIERAYTTNKFNENVVNLLLIENEEGGSHYVWIKSINALLASKTNHKVKYVCSQCMKDCFSSQDSLDYHIKNKLCQSFNIEQQHCTFTLPSVGENGEKPTMKFRNDGNSFKHPFHVIADFESTLEKVVDDHDKSTQKYQHHIANSYGLKYNCIHHEYSEDIRIFNSPSSEEVCENFILDLERLAKKSYELTQQNKNNITMSDDEKAIYKKCTNCDNCKIIFDAGKHKKVRHHDHITGEFIGTYCNECNLNHTYKRFLPVYLHNLKGYDSHLFVKSLYEYGYREEKGENITCIPNNEEKYISFAKNIKVGEYINEDDKVKDIMYEIRFLDTLSFMACSIDSLSENLAVDCKTMEEKRSVFKNISEYFSDDRQFELMIKKGIYPYDYIDKYSRLYETKLPSIECFDSQLYNSSCSEEDYEIAKTVWNTFNCKSMMNYHNLYLITDVLLLADIWENFRSVCYKNYELDCEYYYTAPGLSFDAMLKCSGVELDLLTDLKMFEFVESGIRGGISQISKRHAVANNKYMKSYDESKEDSYILYGDENNLYAGAMCESLPYKDFMWNKENWTKEKILALDDCYDDDDNNDKDDNKETTGYLFSVDLHIPKELHNYMNNYPPCPENIVIQKEYLSEWQKEDYKTSKVKKLCCTFNDKKNYVINYRYLKLVLSLGVELIKVNEVVEYTQKKFMKKYIMKNTNLRKASKNEFEKDFYKLMNNSVFGKTMENVRNRINFRLICTEEQAMRVKNMKRFTIFNDNLVGLHIHKKEVKLCKPIYLGQNILDDSKHTMYDFHYNFMLKKIDRENIDLLFTDTDSLCYHIRKQDIFEVIKKNSDYFDLSNYPKDHELYSNKNCKVLNKVKNESPSQITEFIGLRPKLYSYKAEGDDKNHNKCKGGKKCVVDKSININDYRKCLYDRESKTIEQNGIRSYGHEIYTEKVSKIALSCNDDKVYICDDNVRTRNHGHYLNNMSWLISTVEKHYKRTLDYLVKK